MRVTCQVYSVPEHSLMHGTTCTYVYVHAYTLTSRTSGRSLVDIKPCWLCSCRFSFEVLRATPNCLIKLSLLLSLLFRSQKEKGFTEPTSTSNAVCSKLWTFSAYEQCHLQQNGFAFQVPCGYTGEHSETPPSLYSFGRSCHSQQASVRGFVPRGRANMQFTAATVRQQGIEAQGLAGRHTAVSQHWNIFHVPENVIIITAFTTS